MNINDSRNSGLKDALRSVFQSTLRAVDGERCVEQYLHENLPDSNIWLIAIGKAACSMASGACRVLGERLQDGLVITKQGGCALALPGFEIKESGHPLPDRRSLEAGDQLLAFLRQVPAGDELLFLISGGASALVEVLPAGLSVDDLHDLNQWLLSSGLPIDYMNAIRKGVSAIKGGRLAQHLGGRKTTVLLISDVEGDDPAVIGSGLLFPTTNLSGSIDQPSLPSAIQKLLAQADPTPEPGASCFENISWQIVASLEQAVNAADYAARQEGFDTVVHRHYLQGDAIVAGQNIAAILQAQPGKLHIWGGETTTILPAHPGRGGRCQSLALSAAIALQHQTAWALLAAGTDGDDGNSQAAGACIDASSLNRAQARLTVKSDPNGYLRRADAATFFAASSDLLKIGPTATNVTDLVLGYRHK